jgi:hypothetical protein
VPIPRVFLYRNDGAGVLQTLPPLLSYDGFASGIAVADLNFDGNTDLISSVAAGMGVFLGNGNLTFQESVVSGAQTYEFSLADMDLDGHLDAVVIPSPPSFGTYFVGVSFGNGDGTFDPPVTYPGASGLESAFRVSNDITTADINGDNYPDVVTSNNAPNDITLFVNQGNGTLGAKQHYGAGHSAQVAFFADFTSDGIPDVAPIIGLPPSGIPTAVVLLRGLPARRPSVPRPEPALPVRSERVPVPSNELTPRTSEISEWQRSILVTIPKQNATSRGQRILRLDRAVDQEWLAASWLGERDSNANM